MLLLQAATVRLRKLDAMPVLPPLPPTQATPRVGSSSSCPSIRLKPGDCPPTRARGSAVSVRPAAARLGMNQTGGWSERIGIFSAVDRYGRSSCREPAIGPALHLRYWPIQIEKNFFIFTLPACALGRTKLAWANLDDSN